MSGEGSPEGGKERKRRERMYSGLYLDSAWESNMEKKTLDGQKRGNRGRKNARTVWPDEGKNTWSQIANWDLLRAQRRIEDPLEKT